MTVPGSRPGTRTGVKVLTYTPPLGPWRQATGLKDHVWRSDLRGCGMILEALAQDRTDTAKSEKGMQQVIILLDQMLSV